MTGLGIDVTTAVVCPMTPLLFRHLSGLADPLAELRVAAVAAVSEALADADEVLVLCPVGGREAPGDWRDPAHSGPVHGEPRSLAAQVAEHVLALAGCTLPTAYADVPGDSADPGLLQDPDARVALLVMGDGAAARRDGAPGHIDERSYPYDDHLARLLADGDGAGLRSLDPADAPGLGAELLATGRWTFPVLGELMPRAARAELRYRDDPFGLTYLVALWRP